jgi:hypothetical protein
MPKIKVVFSRSVEVEVDDTNMTEEQELSVVNKAQEELDSLIHKGEFFISDMDVEFEK